MSVTWDRSCCAAWTQETIRAGGHGLAELASMYARGLIMDATNGLEVKPGRTYRIEVRVVETDDVEEKLE